ncbi:MAG: hypothetical protein AB8B91_15060 [Rubripirellula sp.]
MNWKTLILLSCLMLMVGQGESLAVKPEALPSYSHSQSLREDSTLRAVAFAEGRTGIACGDRGVILRSDDGGRTWKQVQSRLDCRLNDVVWIDPQRAIIVGGGYDRITTISRGAVLFTNDAGRTWQTTSDSELPLLNKLQVREDRSVTAVGDWSDSLLTRQFETHDGGKSWHGVGKRMQSDLSAADPPTAGKLVSSVRATGVSVAIRDACRIDAKQMCAVGDHGVVLHSADAGRSWKTVRGENRRTAVLVVAQDAQTIGWSLLGSEVFEHQHRVSLLLNSAANFKLACQVTMMLGGATADLIGDADSNQNIERLAAEWIFVHRPAAIVLDSKLPTSVQDAFFAAATELGVARVATYALDSRGPTSLHANALMPHVGLLASDLHMDAMHLISPHRRHAPATSLRSLYDASGGAGRGDSVASGIVIGRAQKLDAKLPQASRHQLQITQARMKQSKRVEQLLRSSGQQQFADTLGALLDQTAKDDQFRLAWSIVQATSSHSDTRAIGFYETALNTFANRFDTTSAGQLARIKLNAMKNSVEWQRLRSNLIATPQDSGVVQASRAVPVSPFQLSSETVSQASATAPLLVATPETYQVEEKQQRSKQDVDLAWEFHPLVLFAREAARDRSDDGKLQVAEGSSANLQRLALAAESDWAGLLQSSGHRVVIGRRTPSPPKLDGKLDDPCWQSALRSIGKQGNLRVRYDDEYVYVGFQCPAAQMALGATARDSATGRDHDLSKVDRFRLAIDIDRDLLTAMEFQLSAAGRTVDSIDGNPEWQPTWYPAIAGNGDHASIEIAILRRDLVDLPIAIGESWFVSATTLAAGEEASHRLVPEAKELVRVTFQ